MDSGMVLVGPRLIDFLPLLRADRSGTVAAVVADAAGVAPRPDTSRPHTTRTYELAGRHRRLWTSLLTGWPASRWPATVTPRSLCPT